MATTDFTRDPRGLYRPPSDSPVLVTVPRWRFLMLDGQGGPDAPAYRRAIETLFAMSYAIKFAIKRAGGPDYRVLPIETQWWGDSATVPAHEARASWQWTAMIRQPLVVSRAALQASRALANGKGLADAEKVRMATFPEGRCAQVLHVGPFSAEHETIERLHAFIAAAGKRIHGRHHEIYLSDIRRAVPAKWRTILRQPIR